MKSEESVAISDVSLGYDEALQRELLAVLDTQARAVALPVFITASVYSYFAYGDVPILTIALWVVAFILILFLRFKVLTALPHQESIPLIKRLEIASWLSLINGCVHGASLVFFPYFTLAERSIQTLIQLGLTSGSVATTAGYKPLFLTFNIPMLGTLAVMWIIIPYEGGTFWSHLGIASLIIFYFVVQISVAKNYFKFFQNSIKISIQYKELNNKLNKALARSEEASEAKTRFLASASHDLRQPIHALQLFSTVMTFCKLDDKGKETAAHMQSAIENLASQMDSLLDVSKLDAGLVTNELVPIELNNFVRRITRDMAPVAKEKKLKLSFEEFDGEVVVDSDREQLERVIRNLISNAIKYTKEGGIQLKISDKNGLWQLEINDTGIGISDKQQKFIFEEFYQVANKERDRKKGLGLGLSIVKRLCVLLDISIELKSTIDVGTTIYLDFKKSGSEAVEFVIQVNDVSIEGVKIVCLDDEAEVREAMSFLLKEMGCRVKVAKNVSEMCDLIENFSPDILLSDFRLAEDENGIDAIEKARNIIPNLPAILISGDIAPGRLKQASKAGLDILHKPVNARLLQQEIYNGTRAGK